MFEVYICTAVGGGGAYSGHHGSVYMCIRTMPTTIYLYAYIYDHYIPAAKTLNV